MCCGSSNGAGRTPESGLTGAPATFFGETRTLSIAIYDRVQAFDMAGAHIMALMLAALAFVFAAGSARPLQER